MRDRESLKSETRQVIGAIVTIIETRVADQISKSDFRIITLKKSIENFAGY